MMNIKETINAIGSYEKVAKLLGKSVRQINNYVSGTIRVPHNVEKVLIALRRGEIMDLDSGDKTPENVKSVIKELGGNAKVAKALTKTYQAVYKWSTGQSMPDNANWFLMKNWLKERAKNDTKDLEKEVK